MPHQTRGAELQTKGFGAGQDELRRVCLATCEFSVPGLKSRGTVLSNDLNFAKMYIPWISGAKLARFIYTQKKNV